MLDTTGQEQVKSVATTVPIDIQRLSQVPDSATLYLTYGGVPVWRRFGSRCGWRRFLPWSKKDVFYRLDNGEKITLAPTALITHQAAALHWQEAFRHYIEQELTTIHDMLLFNHACARSYNPASISAWRANLASHFSQARQDIDRWVEDHLDASDGAGQVYRRVLVNLNTYVSMLRDQAYDYNAEKQADFYRFLSQGFTQKWPGVSRAS